MKEDMITKPKIDETEMLRLKLSNMLKDVENSINQMSPQSFSSLKSKAAINLFVAGVNSIMVSKDQELGKSGIMDSLDNPSTFVKSYQDMISRQNAPKKQ